MIYLPLFGKDSLPQSSSRIIGFSATILFWVIIFCIFAIINPQKEEKERFTTIQIVLEEKEQPIIQEIIPEIQKVGGNNGSEKVVESSTPVVKTVAEAKIPVPKVSNKINNQDIQKSVTSKSNSQENYKKVESPPTDYSKSVDDLMSANLNGVKKAAVWDESLFTDTSTAVTNSTSIQNSVVNKETSLSGSAGLVNNQDSSKKSVSNNKESVITENASDNTSKALSRISSASYTSSSLNANSTSSMNTTKSSEGKLQIEMQDGTVRTLIEPLTPSISLSTQASSLIDSKVSVIISFRVNENGNVLQVNFQNQSILPELVRNEIEAQILRWRFESASFTSIATFKYTIEKK